MRLRVATFLSPNLEPFYRSTAGYLSRMLACDVDFVVGDRFDRFASRDIDVGFICGLPYVQLTASGHPVFPLAAPVVEGERYGNSPVYYSDVIVRADHPARRFADLRRGSWCFNDVDSHSGYGVVVHHLAEINETTAFFRRFEPVGFHMRALRAVADGDYDAAAIDSHVLDVVRRDEPALVSDLKVIDALGPSTIQPVVAAAHLEEKVRDELRAVLTSMHDNGEGKAALERGLVRRFAVVEDADYDDIRQMWTAGATAR